MASDPILLFHPIAFRWQVAAVNVARQSRPAPQGGIECFSPKSLRLSARRKIRPKHSSIRDPDQKLTKHSSTNQFSQIFKKNRR
jgi:hypothetical protein